MVLGGSGGRTIGCSQFASCEQRTLRSTRRSLYTYNGRGDAWLWDPSVASTAVASSASDSSSDATNNASDQALPQAGLAARMHACRAMRPLTYDMQMPCASSYIV